MSGKVKSLETEGRDSKLRSSREKVTKETSKSDLKKSRDEKKKDKKSERYSVDSSEEFVVEGSLSTGTTSESNSAWKRIRPKSVKTHTSSTPMSSTYSSPSPTTAPERTSSSDFSHLAAALPWSEEKSRIETLCIEVCRLEWKLRFLKDRPCSYTLHQGKLFEDRTELNEKRTSLLEKFEKTQNGVDLELLKNNENQYNLMMKNLNEATKVLKIKIEELRGKVETESSYLDKLFLLSNLIRVLEPFTSFPPLEQYHNSVLQSEIDTLQQAADQGEKHVKLPEQKSYDISSTIQIIITSVESLVTPIKTCDPDTMAPILADLEKSTKEFIEKYNTTKDTYNNISSQSSNNILDPAQELYLIDVTSIESGNDDSSNDSSDIRFSEKKEGDQYPQIKAATVNKLVERLTFQKYPDMAFQKAFLLTYRSFMTPMELMEKLILRFCISPLGEPTQQEYDLFRKVVQTPIQLRVVNVLRTWIENFWRDFDDDIKKWFIEGVENVIALINQKLGANLLQTFQKKDQNSGSKTIQRIQKPPPAPKLPKNLDGPLTFDDLDAVELARQLTLLEHRLYKAIQPKELLHQAWSKKDKESRAPNVLSMIRMFNKISNWVCSEIVGTSDLPSRAQKLGKFIQIAKECYQYNNFNGTLEIVAALGNSAVFRLKKTWEEDSVKKSLEDLESMKQLMETNYKKFRDELHHANPPCIPYIGIFLTDLTFTEDGMPNTLEGKLINFQKLRQVAEKIQEIQQYQNDFYNFTEVPEIQKYLNDIQEADDDTLYKLSQKIESKKLNKFFG